MNTVSVPVSDPRHPSHQSWLQIILAALGAAIAIGPAVVAVVDPKDAALAGQLGSIAGAGVSVFQGFSDPVSPVPAA